MPKDIIEAHASYLIRKFKYTLREPEVINLTEIFNSYIIPDYPDSLKANDFVLHPQKAYLNLIDRFSLKILSVKKNTHLKKNVQDLEDALIYIKYHHYNQLYLEHIELAYFFDKTNDETNNTEQQHKQFGVYNQEIEKYILTAENERKKLLAKTGTSAKIASLDKSVKRDLYIYSATNIIQSFRNSRTFFGYMLNENIKSLCMILSEKKAYARASLLAKAESFKAGKYKFMSDLEASDRTIFARYEDDRCLPAPLTHWKLKELLIEHKLSNLPPRSQAVSTPKTIHLPPPDFSHLVSEALSNQQHNFVHGAGICEPISVEADEYVLPSSPSRDKTVERVLPTSPSRNTALESNEPYDTSSDSSLDNTVDSSDLSISPTSGSKLSISTSPPKECQFAGTDNIPVAVHGCPTVNFPVEPDGEPRVRFVNRSARKAITGSVWEVIQSLVEKDKKYSKYSGDMHAKDVFIKRAMGKIKRLEYIINKSEQAIGEIENNAEESTILPNKEVHEKLKKAASMDLGAIKAYARSTGLLFFSEDRKHKVLMPSSANYIMHSTNLISTATPSPSRSTSPAPM